jgi:hypothetical protein
VGQFAQPLDGVEHPVVPVPVLVRPAGPAEGEPEGG